MANHDGITESGAPALDATAAAGAPEAAPGLVPELAAQPVTDLVDLGHSLLGQADTFIAAMLRPWNAYQIGIALGLWAFAHIFRSLLAPQIRNWMASRDNWPKWRMRILVVVHQRLRPIFFVILLWIAVFIMREITWPSRSYILGIIASLASAWIVVVFATRLIRSILLRRLVRYGAWAYVTLQILGQTSNAARLLDSAALETGEFRISLLLIIQAVVILGVLIAAARFFTTTTSRRIQSNEDISPSMRVLIVKVLQIGFYGFAFYIGVKAIGIDLTGLAVLSGAIGVGLGFGLQKVVSNLVSGVIILLDKSIKPGDVISLGQTFGWINTLGARYASVVTRDGKEYLIPNEDLITNQVVNWSHSDDFVRLDIFFGTAYADDPHQVRKLAIEAAKTVNRVLTFKAPVCHIVGFGDSSLDFEIRVFIQSMLDLMPLRHELHVRIEKGLREGGIVIPFPQRDLWMRTEAQPVSAQDLKPEK